MQFELTDIITILAFLGAVVGVYTRLRKDQVRSDTIIDQHEREIAKLVARLSEEKTMRDIANKELWQKLIKIESNQNETNVFLRENLKSINKLLAIHDDGLKNLQDKIQTRDDDMMEFYKTYKLEKKDS